MMQSKETTNYKQIHQDELIEHSCKIVLEAHQFKQDVDEINQQANESFMIISSENITFSKVYDVTIVGSCSISLGKFRKVDSESKVIGVITSQL